MGQLFAFETYQRATSLNFQRAWRRCMSWTGDGQRWGRIHASTCFLGLETGVESGILISFSWSPISIWKQSYLVHICLWLPGRYLNLPSYQLFLHLRHLYLHFRHLFLPLFRFLGFDFQFFGVELVLCLKSCQLWQELLLEADMVTNGLFKLYICRSAM